MLDASCRFERFQGRVARASEARITHDLELVIHLGRKWVELPKLKQEHPRRRDPYWSYLKGSLAKLSRSLRQVTRVHKKAGIMPRTFYSNLLSLVRDHNLIEAPEGFCQEHLKELEDERKCVSPYISTAPVGEPLADDREIRDPDAADFLDAEGFLGDLREALDVLIRQLEWARRKRRPMPPLGGAGLDLTAPDRERSVIEHVRAAVNQVLSRQAGLNLLAMVSFPEAIQQAIPELRGLLANWPGDDDPAILDELGAVLKLLPIARREAMQARRAPSARRLRAVADALGGFLNAPRHAPSRCVWAREDHFWSSFVALADALQAVRPEAASCAGWPPRVSRALPVVVRDFDALVEEWGWSPFLAPEPLRSARRDERFATFREAVERPYFEAALSIQAEWSGVHCPHDETAAEGKALGFSATMTATEAAERFPEAERVYLSTPRLGTVRPGIDGELYDHLSEACNVLLEDVKADERLERPIVPEAPTLPEPPAGIDCRTNDSFPIILNGVDEEPIVLGKLKPRLTIGQYRVVEALIKAHPERVSKDSLARRSGVEDPIKMIDRLRRQDKDWEAVLDKPGKPHGGYGIRVSKRRKPTPRKD